MDDILRGWTGEVEFDTKKLQTLAIKVDKIMREELEKSGVEYNFAEARIYDVKCVGVQGDNRTYGHPTEITLRKENGMIWETEFLSRLSARITNEVDGVNRVVYVLK